MGVPCSARAGLKGDQGARDTGPTRRAEQRIHPAGKDARTRAPACLFSSRLQHTRNYPHHPQKRPVPSPLRARDRPQPPTPGHQSKPKRSISASQSRSCGKPHFGWVIRWAAEREFSGGGVGGKRALDQVRLLHQRGAAGRSRSLARGCHPTSGLVVAGVSPLADPIRRRQGKGARPRQWRTAGTGGSARQLRQGRVLMHPCVLPTVRHMGRPSDGCLNIRTENKALGSSASAASVLPRFTYGFT